MLQEIIVLTVAYIVLIGLLQPNKTTATVDPVTAPIDYFPEVEEETTQPQPVTAIPAQPKPKATISNLIKEEVSKKAIAVPAHTANPDLSKMGVRALYALAKAKGNVKNYKKLSKAQLIQALA